MKTWFSSDIHAYHKNIVCFTNRGQETTQENHEVWLKTLWNSTVEKNDTVYVLGDISFGKFKETIDFLKDLQGNIIVIKGNHDNSSTLNKLKGLYYIRDWHDYKEIKIKDISTCLFHFPITAWHKQGYGSWHLHGHCHGSFQGEGKSLDVGLDNSYNLYGKHRLFSEEDIKSFMNTRVCTIVDHHKNRVDSICSE